MVHKNVPIALTLYPYGYTLIYNTDSKDPKTAGVLHILNSNC